YGGAFLKKTAFLTGPIVWVKTNIIQDGVIALSSSAWPACLPASPFNVADAAYVAARPFDRE
ncbi:hypothetical protein SK128_001230, partial [Halocaridina rubra]